MRTLAAILCTSFITLYTSVAFAQQPRFPDVAPEPLALPPAQETGGSRTGSRLSRGLTTPDSRSTGERINRINRMLGRLRREISKRKQSDASDAASLPTRQVSAPIPQIGTYSTSPPMPAPPQETKAVSVEPLPLDPVQRPVSLTSTVDSLSLANSLFAQGKIEEAKPIYEKLAAQTRSPSDLIWIQYQLACCYRADGQIKEAIRLYRIVSAATQEPYWAGRAQWWLKYLGKAQELEQRRQKLDETVAAAKKELDGLQDKE